MTAILETGAAEFENKEFEESKAYDETYKNEMKKKKSINPQEALEKQKEKLINYEENRA